MTIDIPEGYEALGLALGQAVAQAACGKGAERHAESGEKFSDQLIMSIPKRLGPGGECFCLGQALKKLCESRRLPQDRARAERLGAINYLAAAWCLLGGRESVFAPESEAPRTKEELARRIREVNPAVYPPEDCETPLFPERTPVECRPPLESEWTPAFYIGVDPAGFHIVERGDGLRMHLSADAVRKPEDADKPRFQKGELVEFRPRDGKWRPAAFDRMDGNFAVVVSRNEKFRVPACDVRPAEKS